MRRIELREAVLSDKRRQTTGLRLLQQRQQASRAFQLDQPLGNSFGAQPTLSAPGAVGAVGAPGAAAAFPANGGGAPPARCAPGAPGAACAAPGCCGKPGGKLLGGGRQRGRPQPPKPPGAEPRAVADYHPMRSRSQPAPAARGSTDGAGGCWPSSASGGSAALRWPGTKRVPPRSESAAMVRRGGPGGGGSQIRQS